VQAVRDILGRLAVVDVETTGLDPADAHVIEVGVLFVEPAAEPRRRSWLVRPPGPVPAFITALTGMDEASLSGAPPFGAVEAELREALAGWTLVAHNAAFERSFLREVVGGSAFIDSCVVTHLLFPELPSHALDALVRWAGVGAGAQHRALGDCEDTLKVLEVAVARVVAAGRRADLDVLLAQLGTSDAADARALAGLLARLRDATPDRPPREVPAERCADERLERLMDEGLSAAGPSALELERPGVTAAALHVARQRLLDGAPAEAPLVLAVPRRTLRELAPSSALPVVQRRPTCRVHLEALIELPGADDRDRLARAYLASLLRRSPLLVPSSWFTARHPTVGALMRAAGPCRCADQACASAPAAVGAAVLVTHELALDWLEQRVPMRLLAVDADRLPAAERRRTSLHLDAARLVRLAGQLATQAPALAPLARQLSRDAEALDEALTALAGRTGLTVDLRARALGPWLRLRDVLTALRKDVTAWLATAAPDDASTASLGQLADELARLAEPPPPGFDVRVHAGPAPVLALEPRHPEAVVIARLPRTAVLVASSRGSLDWTRLAIRGLGPEVRPAVELLRCVASVGAVASHAARLALTLAGPVNLVAEGPLAPFAEAVREGFPRLPVRTVPGAAPPGGACVTLVPWPGPGLPEALATLVGPVRDVRRAVLACGERDVTVLAPAERWSELEAQLDDLLETGPGLHLPDAELAADAGLR